MATQLEKEKIRRTNYKTYAIIGGVAYIFAMFTYFQFAALRRNNPRLSIGEALNKAMINVFIHPAGCFPITGSEILMFFLLTLLAASALVLVWSEKILKKHDNPDTVNGEAHLMNIKELEAYNLKFASPLGKPEIDGANNMIIAKDIRLAIDNRGTRRNCNILVIGGSGAGKSRFFAAPNILQYNCNFVITDPSGEMLRDYGKALEDNGYAVKVFNLTDVYRSNRYNPFHYIKEEKDVFTLVSTLIKNTTPEGKGGGDPFWEKSEELLLTALILYLWHTAPVEQQNFTNVVRMLNLANVDENNPDTQSELDLLFEELEREDPENLAVAQYHKFKLGAGKTLKSILISVGVRLKPFELSDIKYLTSDDDFEFERFSDTKQALFVIIPTADMTFNFIVSLLYSQLFSSLYTYAETKAEYGWCIKYDNLTNIRVIQANNKKESDEAKKKCEKLLKEIQAGTCVKYDENKKLYKVYTKRHHILIGWRGTKESVKEFRDGLANVKIEQCGARCPTHVRLILDEFANIGQIPDFDQKLATMRKYEISCSIILQALSQLKDIYKDKWNTIVANCDTKLFLGCDDSETIEWMLKMLGKKTTTVQNTSYQQKGSGSTSYNKSSLELLTIDQITMMQDNECLVRIRGVRPYYGKKYELTDHPNYKYAKSVSGNFEVPLSDDAKYRRSGPLSQRQKLEKQGVINAAGSAEEQPAQEQKDEKVTVGENKKSKQNAKIQNKSKKAIAGKAKEDLKKMDAEIPDEIEASIAEDFAESVGISVNSTDAEIKESAETMVQLMQVPDGEMVFKKTG